MLIKLELNEPKGRGPNETNTCNLTSETSSWNRQREIQKKFPSSSFKPDPHLCWSGCQLISYWVLINNRVSNVSMSKFTSSSSSQVLSNYQCFFVFRELKTIGEEKEIFVADYDGSSSLLCLLVLAAGRSLTRSARLISQAFSRCSSAVT